MPEIRFQPAEIPEVGMLKFYAKTFGNIPDQAPARVDIEYRVDIVHRADVIDEFIDASYDQHIDADHFVPLPFLVDEYAFTLLQKTIDPYAIYIFPLNEECAVLIRSQ